MLLRKHSGKAWFRSPELYTVKAPEGSFLFDGIPVTTAATPAEGFVVRDHAADSAFVRIEHKALGLQMKCEKEQRNGAVFYDVTLADATGKDRALTFYYCARLDKAGAVRWQNDPVTAIATDAGREYSNTSSFRVGSGRLSKYPFAAVSFSGEAGNALGIDLDFPAFYRVGYNAGSKELFIALMTLRLHPKSRLHVSGSAGLILTVNGGFVPRSQDITNFIPLPLHAACVNRACGCRLQG